MGRYRFFLAATFLCSFSLNACQQIQKDKEKYAVGQLANIQPVPQKKDSLIHTDNSEQDGENAYISIDLTAWSEEDFPAPVEVVVQKDHSLHRSKKYSAYPFKPILDTLVAHYQLLPEETQIVFECKDGYVPSNTLEELYEAGGGYLAFKDLSAEAGALWPEELAANYAPFYLVWENVPYEDRLLQWPYGLVRLRLIKHNPYKSIYPFDQPNLIAGFEHFKLHCIKCHSLNKIGGNMGPEFNHPRNITEYWTRENIVSYAQNPSSFRYNSKMYAIKSLNVNELHAVVDYLEYMADRKIGIE